MNLQFEYLDLLAKQHIQEVTSNFKSYSDFNFASLFTWDVHDNIQYALEGENLVIKFTDYVDNYEFYSIIGKDNTANLAVHILEYCKKQDILAELRLVPEEVAKDLEADARLAIQVDPDNADYILSVPDLVEFRTNKYRGKRNLLNRFYRNYEAVYEAAEIDLNIPEERSSLLMVFKEWEVSRNKSQSETDNEFQAVNRALAFYKQLDTRAFGIKINGQLVAFTLYEVLQNKGCVIHYDKAIIDYIGIFEALKHEFAKHVSSLGIEWINYEQDLGIEGLRRAKQSYHPVSYLNKYNVTLKQ